VLSDDLRAHPQPLRLNHPYTINLNSYYAIDFKPEQLSKLIIERVEGAKAKEERFLFLISLHIILQKKEEEDPIQHLNMNMLTFIYLN
jgi:hypothetical protein